MKKIFFLLICINLFARENPFLPKDNIEITNENKNLFKDIIFKAPENIKNIDSVTILYTDNNGKKIKQKININKNIITKNTYISINLPENFDEMNLIDDSMQNKKEQIYNIGNEFSFVINDSNIIINTKNELLQHSLVKNPYRIIMDFNKNIKLKSIKYNIDKDNIKEIYTGVHKNFYRIVIKLKNINDYKFEKIKNGYTLIIKENE